MNPVRANTAGRAQPLFWSFASYPFALLGVVDSALDMALASRDAMAAGGKAAKP